MDHLAFYIEEKLLAPSFFIAALFLCYRWMMFLVSFLRFQVNKKQMLQSFVVAARILFPLHRLLFQRPLYSGGRILFHILILAIPIGLSQHIDMWQDSGIYLKLFMIPDRWVGVFTMIVLMSIAYLFVRRTCFSHGRGAGDVSGYLLLSIVALPFLTGYLLSNVKVDMIPWLDTHLYTIHVLSGEIFIVTIGILICRVKLQPKDCTGCAACDLNCPANAISFLDTCENRRIEYNQTPCIYCGTCVAICPDHACSLEHAFWNFNPLNLKRKRKLNELELTTCNQCGSQFASKKQLLKLVNQIKDRSIEICSDCRKKNESEKLYQEIFRK